MQAIPFTISTTGSQTVQPAVNNSIFLLFKVSMTFNFINECQSSTRRWGVIQIFF